MYEVKSCNHIKRNIRSMHLRYYVTLLKQNLQLIKNYS